MKVYLVGTEREFDKITVDDAIGVAIDHGDIMTLEEYIKLDNEFKKYYIAIIS